jgi:signal transduction histidine kinase
MMNAVNNTIDQEITINVKYDQENSKLNFEITDKGIGIQQKD